MYNCWELNFYSGYFCFTGRKSFHCEHDLRFPDSRKTVFYFRPDEWWGPSLSLISARRVQRARGSLLCFRGHTRTWAYAQSICCLQRFKGKGGYSYVNLLSPFSMNCVLLWGFCVNVFMPFWIKGLLLYFSFWRLF